MNAALTFAYDVIAMQERISELEYQVARLSSYEEKYNQLLGETLNHNESMTFGLLQVGLEMAALKSNQKAGSTP